MKTKRMSASNIVNDFELVYCLLPKVIMKRGEHGYFSEHGRARGVLVKRTHRGKVWYYLPDDYLEWKSFLDLKPID
jgi:hypothetical protein